MVLVALSILRPVPTLQKRTYGESLQLSRSRERREDEKTGDYDRGVRGSIASTPWEENAHARVSRP
jgi:hypothetical protein